MKSHYRGHKMAIWLNLIPQLHQAGDGDVSMRHHNFHERDDIYYSGVVRAESFTRLPTPQHASTAASYSAGAAAVECSPNTTGLEVDVDTVDSESEELLATTQHSSYSAALGVTVGVGCLLLVLNILIFAGIYYQRERRHKSALPEDIPLSQLTPNVIKVDEPPPRYPSADAAGGVVPLIHKGACPPPTPPVRTSSNPSTVKKRVHIQEISV